MTLPIAGEAAARRHWKTWVDRHLADYDADPGPTGPRRDLAHVGAPEVGRDPPADNAGRPARTPDPARQRRRTALSWRGGSSTPTCSPGGPRPRASTTDRSSPGWPTTSPARRCKRGRTGGPGSRSWTRGCGSSRPKGWIHNRVRMIVASFLVKDLHIEWQHGARHFMQLAGGRRPRLEHPRLAVDGRVRHRRGAVLPGVQPGASRARSSTRTATTSAPTSRSSPTSRRRRSTSLATRSSTTATSAPRRSPVMTGCAVADGRTPAASRGVRLNEPPAPSVGRSGRLASPSQPAAC